MPLIKEREHAVDYDKFYELILLAKGEDRSFRDYAKDAGVSHGIFTKIKRREFKPGIDTIISFVSKQASPRNGVTAVDFMEAAGIPKSVFYKKLQDYWRQLKYM